MHIRHSETVIYFMIERQDSGAPMWSLIVASWNYEIRTQWKQPKEYFADLLNCETSTYEIDYFPDCATEKAK